MSGRLVSAGLVYLLLAARTDASELTVRPTSASALVPLPESNRPLIEWFSGLSELTAPRIEISGGTRNVLSIAIAETAYPTDGRETLLECDESAVRPAPRIICTPRIVLGDGPASDRGRHDKGCEAE